MNNFLDLPKRQTKPRTQGLTCLIDNGYPLNYFKDIIQSQGHLIDYIKFGWGTAYITPNIEQKIAYAKKNNIEIFLGGTFFEKAYLQKKLDPFINYVKNLGCTVLEISNGTIDMSNHQKAQFITEFSSDFQIFSEVGYKDMIRSDQLPPEKWIEFIREDLAAGASHVITEARESGAGGMCNSNGELRDDLIEKIIQTDLDMNKLVFEAPQKNLQIYFIEQIGHEVNLANIPFNDVIPLETLRLGLRSDTLTNHEGFNDERS
jgi:phosphosulfolactate synthase